MPSRASRSAILYASTAWWKDRILKPNSCPGRSSAPSRRRGSSGYAPGSAAAAPPPGSRARGRGRGVALCARLASGPTWPVALGRDERGAVAAMLPMRVDGPRDARRTPAWGSLRKPSSARKARREASSPAPFAPAPAAGQPAPADQVGRCPAAPAAIVTPPATASGIGVLRPERMLGPHLGGDWIGRLRCRRTRRAWPAPRRRPGDCGCR